MVFVVVRQIIMPAAMDPDKGDYTGIELLQRNTVPDGDEQVARTMNDVGMTLHFRDPQIGPQMVPQYPAQRQHR